MFLGGYTSNITHSGQNWIITNTYTNTSIPDTQVPNDSDTNHGNMGTLQQEIAKP